MREIKFKRDTAFRKQFFVPESFAHPAKMDAQLLIWIVEKYTSAGETILDPMAGSGTMMLACTLGRNVVLVELEDKFCKMMADNWNEVRMRPQLGYAMSDCQIIQGDARQLEGVLVDKIITSPPYAGGLQGKPESKGWEKLANDPNSNRYGRKIHPSVGQEYSNNSSNIGNLPYGQIDKIVTSPPHGNRLSDDVNQDGDPQRMSYRQSLDSIITSPPYEGSIIDGNENFEGIRKIRGDKASQKDKFRAIQFGEETTAYGKDNIGNLKGQTYLEAMLQVYQQCHAVLKPQGLMILVTKNFIRNKQIVRLDTDTLKLCEQAGFTFKERYYRKLPAQSFWRTIYYQKYPDVKPINHEDVLVFSANNDAGTEEK